MGELMSIHNNEVVALLAEDFERVAQLKTTLQATRERKARLIEEYREHVMGHVAFRHSSRSRPLKLSVTVLRRLPWLNVDQLDLSLLAPAQKVLTGQLRP